MPYHRASQVLGSQGNWKLYDTVYVASTLLCLPFLTQCSRSLACCLSLLPVFSRVRRLIPDLDLLHEGRVLRAGDARSRVVRLPGDTRPLPCVCGESYAQGHSGPTSTVEQCFLDMY